MAKIKLSAIGITNISGKSGGSVFAHNKNGNYVRRLGIATQPQTAKQTLVRGIFGAISRMWGSLTVAQRDAWKIWGAENPKTDQFGDSRPLTGRQAFISVNGNLQTIAGGTLLAPDFSAYIFPTITGISGEILFSSNGVIDEGSISADVLNTSPDIRFVASVAIVSKGADFGTAKNKYVQLVTGASSSLDGTDITNALVALGVAQNNNVYVKVEFVAPNGQKSSAVTFLMSQAILP